MSVTTLTANLDGDLVPYTIDTALHTLNVTDPSKPYWFLDIDGITNVIQYGVNKKAPKGTWSDLESIKVLGYPILYSPTLISFLNAASKHVNILWLTTWRGLANEYYAPAVGLDGPFPVADWVLNPDLHLDSLLPGATTYPLGDWHKFRVLKALSFRLGADARIIWTDDDMRKPHRTALKTAYGTNFISVTPFDTKGLTPDDVKRLGDFIGMDTSDFTNP